MTTAQDLLARNQPRLESQRATVSCSGQSCPNCCRIVRVPITHRDLARLTRHTQHPNEHFIEWLGPDEIDMTGEPESFVALDIGRRLMVLRHAQGGCHLLDGNGRCSEYALRPAACAAYPYALIDATSSEPSRRLFVLPDSPCGNNAQFATEDPSAPIAALEAVQSVETELTDYVALVAVWNRRQNRRRLAGHRLQAAARFLEFLNST